MASSSDTAQLIGLVYASVCGESWDGLERDGVRSRVEKEESQ